MILMIAADASLSLLRVCNRNLTTKQGVYDFASEFGILPVSGSSPPREAAATTTTTTSQ